MPPLPSAIDEETTRAVESLNRRRKDLTTYQIPRLRECKGPLSTQQQYAAELKDDLDAFAQQVDVRVIHALYSAVKCVLELTENLTIVVGNARGGSAAKT